LFKSLTEPGAAYQEVAVFEHELLFGTSRPKAELLASGTRKMPARPFMHFTDRDIEKWEMWMLDHLMEPFLVPD
jgi:hypothetical protein